MRLFLALRLPAEVLASVDVALQDVREAYPGLRWIPRERWHLTLAFFGEVAARDATALCARIGRKLRHSAAMDLRLSGAGRFGDRVLWLGVAGDTERLLQLGAQVAVDERPYRPHLTVARVRQRADLRRVVECLRGYVGPTWHAEQVELIESHLGPTPTYETFETWVLPQP